MQTADSNNATRSPHEIEAWIAGALERRIGTPVAEIDRDLELNAYGLDSVEAVILGGEIADWLGIDVDPAIVIEHPTVARLGRALAAAQAGAPY